MTLNFTNDFSWRKYLGNILVYVTASEILGPIDKMTSLSEMTSKMRHEKCVILGPFPMLIILKK